MASENFTLHVLQCIYSFKTFFLAKMIGRVNFHSIPPVFKFIFYFLSTVHSLFYLYVVTSQKQGVILMSYVSLFIVRFNFYI